VLVSHGAAIRLAAGALIGEYADTRYVPNAGRVVLAPLDGQRASAGGAGGWLLKSWDEGSPGRGTAPAVPATRPRTTQETEGARYSTGGYKQPGGAAPDPTGEVSRAVLPVASAGLGSSGGFSPPSGFALPPPPSGLAGLSPPSGVGAGLVPAAEWVRRRLVLVAAAEWVGTRLVAAAQRRQVAAAPARWTARSGVSRPPRRVRVVVATRPGGRRALRDLLLGRRRRLVADLHGALHAAGDRCVAALVGEYGGEVAGHPARAGRPGLLGDVVPDHDELLGADHVRAAGVRGGQLHALRLQVAVLVTRRREVCRRTSG